MQQEADGINQGERPSRCSMLLGVQLCFAAHVSTPGKRLWDLGLFFAIICGFKDKNGAAGSIPSDTEESLAPQNHTVQTWELPLVGDASYED